MTSPCRTFLFAPGDHARRAEKALSIGADAAILDLEDAVALSAKVAARDAVNRALDLPRTARAYVRVNAFDTPFCHGDIAAVVAAKLDGIFLPKLEEAAQLIAVDWVISALERDRGLAPGGIDLIPIIETARGHADLPGLAACGITRMRRMAFGAADYTLDLGITWSREEAELGPVRAAMVLASRAAGLEAPIDTVWADLRDAEGFAASCARGQGLGFQGRMCIHPDQVPVANAAYSPSAAAVAWAQKVADAFAEAEARGLASIQVEGRFVDYPIVDRARRLLAVAARLG